MEETIIWDGVTMPGTLSPDALRERNAVIDSAKRSDWVKLLAIVNRDRALVNVVRPGGKALYSPLHHAAHNGAPDDVISQLLRLGSFRTTRDARGNRPVDIARSRSHRHLIAPLEPRLAREVKAGTLKAIQDHFHEVIRSRANELVIEHRLRLPEIEVMLEFAPTKVWFAVPGMYGGFSFWLNDEPSETMLVSESWCRVVEGSGQRHVITAAGSELVEDVFV